MDSEKKVLRVSEAHHSALKVYAAIRGLTIEEAAERAIQRLVNDEEKDERIMDFTKK